MKLWELDDRLEAFIARHTDRETGEFDPQMEPELAKMEGERDAKALSVAKFILGLEAEADAVDGQAKAIQKQADRLKKRRDILRNQAKRLRAYLVNFAGGVTAKDAVVRIAWGTSQSVEIYPEYAEEATWPERFVRTKRELDKKKLKEVLQDKADPHHEEAAKFAFIKKNRTLVLK